MSKFNAQLVRSMAVFEENTFSGSLPHSNYSEESSSNSCLSYLKKQWDSWISLNDSWSSKWWYATVHNVTAIIGAGVLSLPSAMAYLTWAPGVWALIFFIILSLVCYWQIIGMHEMVTGRRFDRYHELGQHIFGRRLGFWIVVPLQLTVEIGIDTVYIIAGATSLKKVYVLLWNRECDGSTLGLCQHDAKLAYFMITFMVIQLMLSQLPHFTSLTWVSCIAAFTAVGYSTIAWIAALIQIQQTDSQIFSALGKLIFACAAGHNVAMEIQATIPSTPRKPSKVAMWNGVFFAYVVIACCYLPVALIGYRLYGNENLPDCFAGKLKQCHLLLVFQKPRWLIILANVMVVLHMCGSYQVYAMPLFDTLETFLEKKMDLPSIGFSVRLFTRSMYVAFTCFLAATFPFFGDLQTFFGGFAIVPTTYLIPCIMWHKAEKPRTLGLPWLSSVACIFLGVLLTIACTAGGLRNIIVNARDGKYKFYQ